MGTIIVVLVLLTWIVAGAAWWSSRDGDRPGPTGTTPATGPAAGGLYRFADETAPAGPSDSSPGPLEAKEAKEAKKPKPKKPKHDEDEDD